VSTRDAGKISAFVCSGGCERAGRIRGAQFARSKLELLFLDVKGENFLDVKGEKFDWVTRIKE
jgi:hypothetical protein